MDREKQVKEIYEQIKYNTGSYDSDARNCAEILYDYMGYRKASEVAKEILEYVGVLLYHHFNGTYSDSDLYGFFAKLKKEYEEEN